MQALKIAIIYDTKHPENSLQDVSRGSKLLPIELEDVWPDSDGKRFFMFTCSCSYTSIDTGIAKHKRITACGKHFKDMTIPHVLRQVKPKLFYV